MGRSPRRRAGASTGRRRRTDETKESPGPSPTASRRGLPPGGSGVARGLIAAPTRPARRAPARPDRSSQAAASTASNVGVPPARAAAASRLIERLDRLAELRRGLCDPELGSPGGARARICQQCRDALGSMGQRFRHRLRPPGQDREVVDVEDSGQGRSGLGRRGVRAGVGGADLVHCEHRSSASRCRRAGGHRRCAGSRASRMQSGAPPARRARAVSRGTRAQRPSTARRSTRPRAPAAGSAAPSRTRSA